MVIVKVKHRTLILTRDCFHEKGLERKDWKGLNHQS
jgi:hypothetical protein